MTYEHTRKTYAHGIVGRVVQDADPANPRTDYEHLCGMACWHKRYDLGDPHSYDNTHDMLTHLLHAVKVGTDCPKCAGSGYVINSEGDHEDCPDCGGDGDLSTEQMLALAKEHYYISPLHLYDHSGITISMGAFSCPWDSGQVGWITLRKETALAEWPQVEWANVDDWARHIMEAEVREYDQYLTGDVWGAILDDEDGNALDSCWGMFGSSYALQELDAMADHWVKSRAEATAKEQAAAEHESAECRYWAERDVMTEGARV